MRVLGSAGPRLPVGLLDADEAARLEVLKAAEDPESEMGRARQAFVKLDKQLALPARPPPQE
eukprot:8540731-Alexandrium_andersonii.AAC.1